jgi:hypothetical protein
VSAAAADSEAGDDDDEDNDEGEVHVAKTTMLIGAMLCVLGVLTYGMGAQTGTVERSPTALIPAGFGALLLLLGFGALIKPGARKHFMHAAAAVGLLGALGGFGMFAARVGSRGFTLATGSMLTMGILCAVLVALCVRSFIAARRAREAGGTTTTIA